MDLEQIKKLMEALEDSGLKKLVLKNKDGSEIHLEKPEAGAVHHVTMPAPSVEKPAAKPAPAPLHEKKEEEKPGKFITSPMVGTFYGLPSPDQPPFVKVGDHVKPDTVVCIVEAMKVMNEVKAGVEGVIEEVCVDNAHPVEFGTKLFRVK